MLLSISAYLSISSAICDAITRSKGQVMVWYRVVGLNVPLDDLQSDDPSNSVIALKGNHQSTRSRANPTTLSSPKCKAKNVTKKYNYI